MVFFPRTLATTAARISKQFPALMLTGPRQIGKTTLLRNLSATKRNFVSLDDTAIRELAQNDPRLFLERFPPPVLIDEFQYAPELISHIKLDVDESGRSGDYWLTGSQQFEGMKNITETLAGRVAMLRLLGFSWRERFRTDLPQTPFLPTPDHVDERGVAAPPYDLESLATSVFEGALPALLARDGMDRDIYLSSYLQTYLHRDVRDLAQIGDLQKFDRFVRACAAQSGQLLNFSNLARDTDVSVPTAKHWLSILEASYQVYLLKPFHSNLTKRLVKAPKLYFLDTGLACYLTGWTSPQSSLSGAAAGALVETWAVAEILKSWWHSGREPRVYFYRDRDGREIDLVFDVDGRLHPVEIKLAATPRQQWTTTLNLLRDRSLPAGEGAVLCLTPEPIPLDSSNWALPFGAI